MENTAVKKKKQISDFTKGNPTRLILGFFWPLLLTSMLQQLYNFVDTLIVGKGLGDNALAAVGNMGSLFFLIVGFSLGLSNGFGIMIAQSFGAKEYGRMRRTIASTIQLAVVIAVGLTLISMLLLPAALRLLRTDEVIMDDSLKYGWIVFGGLSAAIAYNVTSGMLRSLGDSKTPLIAILVSSVANLGLDSFFIFVLHTGVEGAAIATVISQVISTLFCVRRLRRIELIRLKREDFHNERSMYTGLLKNGLPMAFMNSITAIGCMVVQFFVNGYGVVYTSAYSVCGKYNNLFMNPAFTVGNAMSAYTSQNYGAKDFQRIREGLRVCLRVAFAAYILLGSVMVFFSHQLATFLLDGEEAIQLAEMYLPMTGVALIFVDVLFVYRSAVQGMGFPVLPMFSGILEMLMRTLVIAFFMGSIGFKATAYAEIAAWTGAMLMNLITYYRIMASKAPQRSVEKKRGRVALLNGVR
ncbi:MAG: MATE family efflux transporter [Eubacterium sp.]|nr:MATE family efflux transporter [Eubacterium sp.]